MRTLWAEFTEPKVSEDGLLRHRLYQLGEWEHPSFGKFRITPELHAEMVKNFEPANLDYDHEWDNISAGQIQSVEAELDSDGWAWGVSRLTPRAIERVNAGEYRGFSPEIEFKAKDRKGKGVGCFLAAGALTNRPFFPIELAAIRTKRLAASMAGFTARTTEANMLELMGRMDEGGGFFVTLPAGTSLPDGTTLDADTEIAVEVAQAEMAEKKKEEEMAMAAQMANVRTENATLKASLKAVNTEVETLKGSIQKLTEAAENERTLRLTNEAKLFTATKHIKPSLQKRVEETFVRLGREEAEALLADIGDSAYIPTGEIGTGAGSEPGASGVKAFQSALDTLRAANPAAKQTTLIDQLRLTMPRQFSEWERADAIS